MSQWPKWLRRQYGKLDICGSSSGYDTNFSLKNYHLKVPEFAMEDVPLSTIAALVPEFAVKDLPSGRTLMMMTCT